MEELYHILLRFIIFGILSSTTADQNFAYPPIPYNQDGISYLSLIPLYQRVPETERQEPFPAYQYEDENDYVYPPYIDQYYYSPYDFSPNAAGNFYYYNYLGYDTNYDYNTPIQVFPSRFPPAIEKLLERIQNYFSTYNYPGIQALAPNGGVTTTTPHCITIPGSESTSAHHVEGTTMRTSASGAFTTTIPEEKNEFQTDKKDEEHATEGDGEFIQQTTEKTYRKEDAIERKEDGHKAEASTKSAAYETTTFVNEVDNT